MNKTIRNLIIAAPLAAGALTLAPAAAMASEPGPVIVLPPAQPDPQPNDQILAPAPQPTDPKGPQDKAPAPKPSKPKGPGDLAPAPKPQGPGDLGPAPKPHDPKGPGDITNPKPCPTHGVDCTDGDEPTGGDDGGNGGQGSTDPVDSVAVPTRIDAGLAADEQDGFELTWLLVGGAVVTATGAGFAARNRLRRNA